MNETNKYYKENAQAFIDNTFSCDMSVQHNFFTKYLNKESKTILDLGFGSGRDMLYFKNQGYDVYGIDPSLEFCDNAKKLGLTNVYQISAKEITFINMFDGIWACASLLHIPQDELKEVFSICYKALKDNGIMYASFKYGTFNGIRNGRYFVDLNEETIKNYIDDNLFSIIDTKITEDVRPDRTEKWLNIILKKRAK